ncbi:hydroxymethylglutaryl-CoA lyase [Rhodovibrio sodomensis]|uniref:Hydroxymethylglutaryl-CoA lyase n=1 Tax=Rhodovibrio sodomensis TaxID=1088 RepID=A0ABS1DLR7_9PROT|nr:hydroxymethylglutaryl-CoA lyase [Rhodovibrio sodomensis]MBK1671475.1 hydroxymethylglutaryl-CoA lyase [Rhodovibrio sodomensis]
MSRPDRVTVVEVGPRDGLQNESGELPVAARVRLITALAAAGLPVVEAGAFVSPKWVPQMAGSAEVLAQLPRGGPTRFPVLVPNDTGLARAREAGAAEIAVFGAASETFSQRNINCGIQESLGRFAPVIAAAKRGGLRVRGYVSCVLGCPYEGAVSPHRVANIARDLAELGCDEISLGDTIGVGTPDAAAKMLETVAAEVAIDRLAVHFHDTYGQALANVLACLERGVRIVDSAVAGLGGCPYAKGASGNLATEDLLYMLHGLGIDTGVDLDAVAAAGREISAALGREPASKVARALAAQGAGGAA